MCGILAALLMQGDAEKNRRDILKLSKLLRHRGPDQNSIYQAPDGRAFIAFERLMIVDPTDTGRQAAAPMPHARRLDLGPALSPSPARPLLQAAVPDRDAGGQHRLGAVRTLGWPGGTRCSWRQAPADCRVLGHLGAACTLLAAAKQQTAAVSQSCSAWPAAPAFALGWRLPAASASSTAGAACHTWAHTLNPPAAVRRNSEIYNHQQLRDTKLAGVDLHSKSDSAVIGYLYQK